MTDDATKPDQALSATEHPLGKGEVVSSILTGSTRKPHEIRASDTPAKFRSAVRDATKREHDISTRGKSVEFVRRPFRRHWYPIECEHGYDCCPICDGPRRDTITLRPARSPAPPFAGCRG